MVENIYLLFMSLRCWTNYKNICKGISVFGYTKMIKGVMTRSMIDALSESCSLFLKGGNFVFFAVIASGLFPQTKYRSLE